MDEERGGGVISAVLRSTPSRKQHPAEAHSVHLMNPQYSIVITMWISGTRSGHESSVTAITMPTKRESSLPGNLLTYARLASLA